MEEDQEEGWKSKQTGLGSRALSALEKGFNNWFWFGWLTYMRFYIVFYIVLHNSFFWVAQIGRAIMRMTSIKLLGLVNLLPLSEGRRLEILLVNPQAFTEHLLCTQKTALLKAGTLSLFHCWTFFFTLLGVLNKCLLMNTDLIHDHRGLLQYP